MKAKLFIASLILATASLANAAATRLNIPLTKEEVLNEKTGEKFCFYALDYVLGDANTAKSYQLFRETDANHFEEIRNWHSVSINDKGQVVLRVTASGTAVKDTSCLASKTILLLN